MDAKALRRRMILAPTPRERERWHAVWLLAQGWTAAATAEALGRDPHTIGRWASAFGEGGPAALIFEQTGGSPPNRGMYGVLWRDKAVSLSCLPAPDDFLYVNSGNLPVRHGDTS